MPHMLQLENISKVYESGGKPLTVLSDICLNVEEGEFLALVGPSGSGKSTLLGLIAGLDRPTSGRVRAAGVELGGLDENGLARFRNQHIGFIFQSFQLIRTLTALENVTIPAELRGSKGVERGAMTLLDRVGLADRAHHYPSQLSGGEQQRVALARAYINRPKLLLADEPTGSLDEENAGVVEELLLSIHREEKTTLIVATHNLPFAARAGRQISLRGGRMVA